MFPILTTVGRRAALLAVSASWLSLGADAAPLTEAEAIRQVLGRPELAAITQAHLGEADADVDEARLWPNPTIEFARDKTGVDTETSWRLTQPFDFSGRRGLRTEAAHYRRRAAEADNRTQAVERVSDARRVFYDVLRAQDHLRVVEAWAMHFARIGEVVDKLARAGEASGYDRRRLALEQSAAGARLVEARGQLERDRGRLASRLGRRVDDGVTGYLLPGAADDLASLRSRLAQRPDLAALRARADAAAADNAAARSNFPELTIGVGGKRMTDGSSRETGTLLSVSLPLPLFDRQQAADRRTAAQAMAARAEFELAQQAAEGELIGLHAQLERLIDVARRYRAEAVGTAAELVRVAETAYAAGESTVLELLDAYRGALEAETTALDLEWKARDARIELDQLTGSLPQ